MKRYLKNLLSLATDWRCMDRYERIDLLVDLSLIATSVIGILYAVYFIASKGGP